MVLPNHQHTPKTGITLVPETSENLHILPSHQYTPKMVTKLVPETSVNLHILPNHQHTPKTGTVTSRNVRNPSHPTKSPTHTEDGDRVSSRNVGKPTHPTKSPTHPEDGDGFSSRNVGKPLQPDADVCPRKFKKFLCLFSVYKIDAPADRVLCTGARLFMPTTQNPHLHDTETCSVTYEKRKKVHKPEPSCPGTCASAERGTVTPRHWAQQSARQRRLKFRICVNLSFVGCLAKVL